MAHLTRDKTGMNARIVFWGIQGAGVSTNLRVIRDKLRADRRGELRRVPTRLDPTDHFEVLPIELGQVGGLSTRLEVIAVPGGREHAPTRKQLLDHVDGLVLVVDSQPDRIEENVASLAELRGALDAYGRSLAELPIVVQYNKRDLSDPFVIEELHRQLGLGDAAVFEAVATEGKGVLQTLTTISKRVVRVLRESKLDSVAPPPIEDPRPIPRSDSTELMENAILAEGSELDDDADAATRAAQQVLDRPYQAVADELKDATGARIGADFEIVSVGAATRVGQRAVRIPLVLGNPEGETVTLALTVQLDPLLDRGEE